MIQVRDLYWTFRNFRNRVADFLRYRQAMFVSTVSEAFQADFAVLPHTARVLTLSCFAYLCTTGCDLCITSVRYHRHVRCNAAFVSTEMRLCGAGV
jgi:hypothetical protein